MRQLTILCRLLMVIGKSGCETIEGLGKDLQYAGEALEKNLKIISNEI